MPSNDDLDTTDEPPRTTPRTDEPTLSRRRLLAGAATTAAVGLAGCTGTLVRIERAEATVEREFDAGTLAELRVDDAADDVGLERIDGDVVQVTAHKRAHGQRSLDELALQSRIDDETLHLTTSEPNVAGGGGGSVALEIGVPRSVRVTHVGTSDGSVGLQGVSGDPTVAAGDGDVAAVDVTGDVDVTTDDGEVVAEGTDGVVSVRSRDGDLLVRDPDAVGDVTTDDGEIVAEVPSVDGTATVRSRDGDVVVSLDEALDAVVEATTDDGRITVAGRFDGLTSVTERRVTGTLGEGTNDLRVHTDDGDVTLTTVGSSTVPG